MSQNWKINDSCPVLVISINHKSIIKQEVKLINENKQGEWNFRVDDKQKELFIVTRFEIDNRNQVDW